MVVEKSESGGSRGKETSGGGGEKTAGGLGIGWVGITNQPIRELKLEK